MRRWVGHCYECSLVAIPYGMTMTWTGRQLTTLTQNGKQNTYKYDVDGLRLEKTAGGVTTQYQYVNGQLLGEKRSNGVILRYTYDALGVLSGIQYVSGEELLKAEQKADIAFLDVEMPGRSGIYVGAELMKRNPRTKIVIVTSYPDYLDEAMRFRVFRYLSKPINKNRLFENLKDAIYQYNIESIRIPVETKDGVVTLSSEDIICLEGQKRVTKICTVDGEVISVKGIQSWQEELKIPSFFASYRNYIVNMKYVVSFSKDLIKLKYANREISAYLANRRYSEFKNKYLLYMEGMQ